MTWKSNQFNLHLQHLTAQTCLTVLCYCDVERGDLLKSSHGIVCQCPRKALALVPHQSVSILLWGSSLSSRGSGGGSPLLHLHIFTHCWLSNIFPSEGGCTLRPETSDSTWDTLGMGTMAVIFLTAADSRAGHLPSSPSILGCWDGYQLERTLSSLFSRVLTEPGCGVSTPPSI